MASGVKYVRHVATAVALELSAEVLAALAERSFRWSRTLRRHAGRCVDSSGRHAAIASHTLYEHPPQPPSPPRSR